MCARDNNHQYSRREFLKLVSTLGGVAAFSSFLQACSQAGIDPTAIFTPKSTQSVLSPETPSTATSTENPVDTLEPESTPAPTESPVPASVLGTGQVAFIKTQDRSRGVRQAIEMCGLKDVHDQNIFLKPNFNSPDPTPGATHPDVLRSIVSILRENLVAKITVGDRSGMGDTRKAMDRLGVFELADELGFNTLIFDDLTPEDWVMIQPTNSHWELGFPFARPLLETDTLIQTCCLKTHRYGGHFTLSLKNSVGMVAKDNLVDDHDFMDELHNSPHQRRMIAEINTAYTPDLVVMDGVECFINGGPEKGELALSEVILAGTDRVAIDAVGVALLRFHGCQTEVARGKIFQQDQIKRAVQLGLGVDKPDKIEFFTEDAKSAAYAAQIQEVLLA
ncbi:MAG: DUF362 domain-containing protein [Anaerolineales bacterium]